jgi:uncharacterized membrane protein
VSKKSIGALMLLAGIVIVASGWFLTGKFRAEANYQGIGSFRFTSRGLAWFAGYLLIIFGFSVASVSLMLLFL